MIKFRDMMSHARVSPSGKLPHPYVLPDSQTTHVYFLTISGAQALYAEEKMTVLAHHAVDLLPHAPKNCGRFPFPMTQLFADAVLHYWMGEDVIDWLEERGISFDSTVVRVSPDIVREDELLRITIKGLTPATEFKLAYSDRILQEQHDV